MSEKELDDFLFEYGRVRMRDGRIKVDLDVRNAVSLNNGKLLSDLFEAGMHLKEQNLYGSVITVGY